MGIPILPGHFLGRADATDYRSTVMSDSPTAYWRMGDATGSGTVDDEVGAYSSDWHNVNGQYSQGASGAIGGDADTASYTGGAWAGLDQGRPQVQQFTIEAWLKVPPGSTTTGKRPIYKFTGSAGMGLYLNDGRPMGVAVHEGPWPSYTKVSHQAMAPMRIDDNAWHHVAFVKDASSVRLYVDGTLAAVAPMTEEVEYESPFEHTIGSALGGIPGYVGSLDEMAIYDTALSQDRIRARVSTAGYALRPLGGDLTAGENPCVCSPGAPHVGGAQASVAQPINTATGNFWHTFAGISVPGRGPALNFKPTYSSQSAGLDGPLGYGWTHPYAMSLSVDAAGVVKIRQENSAELTFSPAGTDYAAPPRVTSRLVHNADGTYTLTRSVRETVTFDASGRLVSIKDLNGYTTSLAYTGAGGKLGTITEPSGRTMTLAYTGSRIASVADTASRVLSFAYDGSGNLTDMTDVGSGVTHFTYDGSHRMLTMLDPFQAGAPSPVPVTNHYDASGRVDWQKDQLGRQTSFDYTSTPGSTKVTDPKGNVVVYAYQYGLLLSVTKAPGTSVQATWSYEYDMATLGVTKVTDPNNHATTMAYDLAGNLLTSTDALNRTTTLTYDGLNAVTSVKDPKNVTTVMEYDVKGNLTKVTTGTQVTAYGHSDTAHPGDVTSMTDPLNKVWTYTYEDSGNDRWGNVTSVTDPVTPTAGETNFCYDGVSRRTATISPKGLAAGVTCASSAPAAFTTYTQYNAFGDVVLVKDPLGHQASRAYDANRNVTSATDALNKQSLHAYDKAGQLTRVTRPDTTHLDYDYFADGSLNHAFDGAGQATTYTYDAQGRLATEADPLGRVAAYGYDLAGNRLTVTQPGGNCGAVPKVACVTHGYDAGDQMTSVVYSDGSTPNVTNIAYDPNGQRTSMSDGSGTSSWTWDDLGRMTQSQDGSGAIVGYAYDLANRRTTIAYPASTGTVTYGYDAAGRMTSVTDWANRTTSFAYDADGFMTSQTYPSTGTVDTFTPDGANRLMSSLAKTGATTLASFTYGRDNADQLSSIATAGVPADTHSYTYSPLNQLKNVDVASYGYDPADNLTTLASGPTLSYDVANQATGIVRPTGSTTFGYDARGNRTSAATATASGRSLAYDQANRLSAVDATAFSPLLSAGWYHTVAAKADGSVSATGYNASGQIGDNTTTDRSSLVSVQGLSGVTSVAAGAFHSLAVRNDGSVWSWGHNNRGQLGIGTITNSSVPVQVPGLTGVVAVAAGTGHSMALRNDGTLWAWGSNSNGQVGNNSLIDALSPVQVLSGVVALGGGGYSHSVAVKADGTVWTWGYNGFGQLGIGNTTQKQVPTLVPGLTGVAAVAAGYYHSLALKADGTVRAWGYNATGQLGDGTIVDKWSPQAVPGLSAVAALAAGGSHSLAQSTSGTLRSWGTNAYGQLGLGNTTQQNTPQVVTAAAGLKGLTSGGVHVTGIKADATATAWGYNGLGGLGDGTTTNRTSAVAVTGYNRGNAPQATYAYDGTGLRMSKTVAGASRHFLWDRSGSLPLAISDGDRFYIYGPGGLPVEQIGPAGTPVWFHHDQLGSTRLLTDTAGVVVGAFTYDAYGSLNGRSGSVTTPLDYAGQYTDAETGMQYLRARYYEPGTGQFISRDPLESLTRKSYAYAGNNPTNATDPTGLCEEHGGILGGFRDTLCEIGEGDLGEAAGAAGRTASETGEAAWRNRGTIATIGAAATCLIPAVGFVGCGYAAAAAFGVRAEQRIDANGFSNSLTANLADGALTYLTWGLGSAFAAHAGPSAGIRGIGAFEASPRLDFLGRLIPAGYDGTNLFGWLKERC